MQKILRKNAFIAPTKLCIVSFLMAQFQDLTIESGMKNLKSLHIQDYLFCSSSSSSLNDIPQKQWRLWGKEKHQTHTRRLGTPISSVQYSTKNIFASSQVHHATSLSFGCWLLGEQRTWKENCHRVLNSSETKLIMTNLLCPKQTNLNFVHLTAAKNLYITPVIYSNKEARPIAITSIQFFIRQKFYIRRRPWSREWLEGRRPGRFWFVYTP